MGIFEVKNVPEVGYSKLKVPEAAVGGMCLVNSPKAIMEREERYKGKRKR